MANRFRFPRPRPAASADSPDGSTPIDLPQKPRCQIARDEGSTNNLCQETECLLRARMRVVTLLFLGTFLLFYAVHAWDRHALIHLSPVSQALHVSLIITNAILAGLLWSPRHLCLRTLRLLELISFGLAAVFFAVLQYEQFHGQNPLALSCPDSEVAVIRIVGLGCAFRWFVLIVLYGIFIPSTWKRSAAVIGGLVLIPMSMVLASSIVSGPIQPYMKYVLMDLVPALGLGTAIAIFGSHKVQELHEQAFEARKFGQYRLKRLLGSGGMGEVYLAEHVLLRRPCAIKLIRPERAGDPKTLIRFEREVQTTASLTHWNTIEIFDYGHTEDGTFYYVMEYLPGLSLEDIIERHGPMPPERAIHLLRQVCQGLREAHSVGLIHRDIKPSNIIACERGKVYDVAKLLDFGLVKSMTESKISAKLTQEGAMPGSPAFMSPEQAVGKMQIDARSDIYNLGAVAYNLLTGELPFDRETPMQMIMAHAYEPVRPLRDLQDEIPLDVQAVVLRCLEKDPERRFQDVGALEESLAQCRSAGDWTQARAAQWWHEHGNLGTTSNHSAAVDSGATTVYQH